MAIIYSYPLNDDIKPLDELVGTTEKNINGQLKTVTRNFLLQDLAEFFIVDGGLQKEIILTTNNISGPATLDQVTGILNIPRYDENQVTSAALTKVNDTNVTLTLGGSPSNALLQEVSLTLGWTGTLADSRITSSLNWNTAYNNRITSLTTTGSGEATLVSNTLNIPTVGVVSATTSGIVNNTSLQELGGVDKTINGVRVGRGNISASASENTAVGYQALQSVTHATGFEGWYNSAFGDSALKGLTTGYANNAFGEWALIACTIGTFNTAVGGSTLSTLLSGTQNVAIGVNALRYSIIGNKNTAVGTGALYRNTGSFNTAIGNLAGGGVTSSGSNNILIGFQAGSNISTGTNNLLIENITNPSITSGSFNIILNPKQKSGVTTGSYNTIIGAFDGTFPTGMANNVLLADGQGNIRFRTTETGLTTVPGQTNALIIADTTGKAIATKEYVESIAGGATNLTTSQTATNFTINSSTGDDATVPLGDGALAGATLNNYTTAEKNKLAAITGTNTGDQDLQSVTTLGATTTKGITINTVNANGLNINTSGSDVTKSPITVTSTIPDATTFKSLSYNGALGNYLYADTGDCASLQTDDPFGIGLNVTSTGIGISAYSIDFPVVELFQALTNKGLTINSGTSSTGNFIELNKNGVDKLTINQQGELSIVKIPGGTNAQILAADGSVITAGTNITISGGQISSVGGSGGGGSTVNYYLNGGTSQGTFGGTTYYEFSKTAVVGTGVDFSRGTNGYIASFITDVADPSLLLIPGGNWNLEFFFSSSSAGGSPSFYVELYKYDGATFTSIASSSATPEGITNGTSIDAYFTSLAVPETILTVNDRLAIRVFVNASSKTITLHTQNGHLCEVITTFTAGLTALNGLQAQVQNFATGTTGTDFAINSSGSTHTFNLPSASATARGVVTIGTQTIAGTKTFSSNIVIPATGTPLILGTSSGGTVSGLTTTTYPDLTELSYVKGVTSAIQTQLNGKQPINANLTSISSLSTTGGVSFVKVYNGAYFLESAAFPSQSAYTMLANNTASSASPTEQPFENLTNQTYTPTPSWTGTTAPSGTTAHTYSLSQIGNLVTLTINLSYGTAGSSLTQVACDLPSTAPTPALPSSVSVVGDVINYGNGMIIGSKVIATSNVTFCALRLKSTAPNVCEVVVNRATGSYRYAYITIQYFV